MPKAYSYIRISSAAQAKGDGIRRQIAKSRKWASDNGLDLDGEISDVGLSGFHGRHVSGGAFGGFISLIQKGDIEPGSVLIIESLDRISRENVLTALSQLIQILTAGIDVVTVTDKKRYSSRDVDGAMLMKSLGIMERAHDESLMKSERALEAISNRIEDIKKGFKRFVQNAPAWISQSRIADTDEWQFSLNNHAATVREIFELYADGVGTPLIAQQMQRNKRRSFKGGVWSRQTALAILRHPAVIGQWSFGGTDVPDYYPRVVSNELFYRVQNILKSKSINAGNKGREFTNLFQGFLRCHHCDGAINIGRGGRKNAYQFMTCVNTSKGVACDGTANRKVMRYAALEPVVLDLTSVFADMAVGKGNRETVALKLEESKTQRAALEKRVANIRSMIESVDSDEDRLSFVTRLNDLRTEIGSCTVDIERLEREIHKIDDNSETSTEIVNLIKSEIAKWPDLAKDDLYVSRSKVSQSLRKLVSVVRIDIDRQEAIVAVGGFIKWWIIGVDGTVRTTGDWSTLPFDILVARSKEFFGSRIDVDSMRAVYDRIDVERADPALWDSERAARGL